MEPELFFVVVRHELGDPKAYAACARCGVADECREDALRFGEPGVRGGLSERARRRLVRERRRGGDWPMPRASLASSTRVEALGGE